MHIVVRSRVFLARHPWVYWAIVLSLGGALGFGIMNRLEALERQRSEWATTRSVLVATDALVPDGPISVRRIDLPLAAIPASAVTELPDGARLHQRVADGEVLVAADLAAGAGPAVHADAGTVVVGIIDPLSPTPSIGLRVHVSAEGVVLSADGTIVGTVDDVVFVAVAERDGPVVAAAAQLGVASLIFVP